MPYEWSADPNSTKTDLDLSLWPYRSLLRKDFVLFVGGTAAIVALPLITLLGTAILWVILTCFAIMLWGLWTALNISYKRGEALEKLSLRGETASLTHTDPKGKTRTWIANRYWATAHLHRKGGPVENYITLRGGDREVEIGAFLDADERLTLFDELQIALRR